MTDRGPLWTALYDNLPDEIVTRSRGHEVADDLAPAVAPFIMAAPELTPAERADLAHLHAVMAGRLAGLGCSKCDEALALLERIATAKPPVQITITKQAPKPRPPQMVGVPISCPRCGYRP